MTRDSFRRFLKSKEFKSVMNPRKELAEEFTVQAVHAPGQATANAFFNYISRKKITKWAMDKVYEVADAFAFTGTPSSRLGSIKERPESNLLDKGSMRMRKKEKGAKMASTLKGSRYDGSGVAGKEAGSTGSFGSRGGSRRREAGVKMVSLRKARGEKKEKGARTNSLGSVSESGKKKTGPKKETGAKMNASLNLAVKRKKSIQYATLGGRISSCKSWWDGGGRGAKNERQLVGWPRRGCLQLTTLAHQPRSTDKSQNPLVKTASKGPDLGAVTEDKSVRQPSVGKEKEKENAKDNEGENEAAAAEASSDKEKEEEAAVEGEKGKERKKKIKKKMNSSPKKSPRKETEKEEASPKKKKGKKKEESDSPKKKKKKKKKSPRKK